MKSQLYQNIIFSVILKYVSNSYTKLKKMVIFFTIHLAMFSQSEMYKTVCLNPSLPQFQFHLEFCLI